MQSQVLRVRVKPAPGRRTRNVIVDGDTALRRETKVLTVGLCVVAWVRVGAD